jgi:cytochrome c oxidase assembly protein CtaG/Cox11
MPRIVKKALLLFLTVAVLVAPVFLWLGSERQRPNGPVDVVAKYLKFLYTRDFRQAYRFISAADRELKSRNDYVRERGAFNGVALDAARKLSSLIEIQPVKQETDGPQSRIKIAVRLPDANAVSDLLLGWDEKKLSALPGSEQKKLLAKIDQLVRDDKLPMIVGEQDFVLVQEGARWKVFLDWAAGIQVKFATILPSNGALLAQPTIKETIARPGDVFTVGFTVKNQSTNEIMTRIVHRVEPKEIAGYLDLVECALLLPVRLRSGEEQTFNSTYMVRGDLPDGTKALDVTYEFKVEN